MHDSWPQADRPVRVEAMVQEFIKVRWSDCIASLLEAEKSPLEQVGERPRQIQLKSPKASGGSERA
jgi:hypothetical protein